MNGKLYIQLENYKFYVHIKLNVQRNLNMKRLFVSILLSGYCKSFCNRKVINLHSIHIVFLCFFIFSHGKRAPREAKIIREELDDNAR